MPEISPQTKRQGELRSISIPDRWAYQGPNGPAILSRNEAQKTILLGNYFDSVAYLVLKDAGDTADVFDANSVWAPTIKAQEKSLVGAGMILDAVTELGRSINLYPLAKPRWNPSTPSVAWVSICTHETGFLHASIANWASGTLSPGVIEQRSGQTYPDEQPPDVGEFLSLHPFLTSLIAEARPIVQNIFGRGTRVSLEIVAEPEHPDQRELLALIHTSMNPELALKRLDAFDDGWWLGAVRRSQGKLNFTLSYD